MAMEDEDLDLGELGDYEEITWDQFKEQVEKLLSQHELDGSVVVHYIDTDLHHVADIRLGTMPLGGVYIW